MKKMTLALWHVLFAVLFLGGQGLFAQAPSHDPSTMIRNNDGRYWIFTTGDGVWAMSSATGDFTDWRAENPVFPVGTYPSWIKNYVSNFSGFFWAPDVVKMNGKFYCYYSCAGTGAPAAIGVATAYNLAGPWTDQGLVYASNNAIDPSILIDDDGKVWMTWGNWQSGIDLVQINPSTGKRMNSSVYKLVDDTVEGPTLLKHNGYYYLFYQRGLCCNGVNSTYYNVVARSTRVTGPYTNERVFLPNKSGNLIGPGHVGYGAGKLTYHYYDGNDNGAAKLMITTLGYVNGWPQAGATGDQNTISVNGTYSIVAKHSGKALDVNAWGTDNGTNIAQWEYWGGTVQQFTISNVDNGWHTIMPVIAPGKALDVNNVSTDNGANIHIWDYWGGHGQQFRFQGSGAGTFRIINRNSEKCLDVEGASTGNGANVLQWECLAGKSNQMFQLVRHSSQELDAQAVAPLTVYPVPAETSITVQFTGEATSAVIVNALGQTIRNIGLIEQDDQIDISELSQGIYMLVTAAGESTSFVKK